jgi:hypothetical protein
MGAGMRLLTIDVFDGKPPIQVCVSDGLALDRLVDFIKYANNAIDEVASGRESECLADLERGYAQDRI